MFQMCIPAFYLRSIARKEKKQLNAKKRQATLQIRPNSAVADLRDFQ
jgi:hypothetical protein